MSFTMFIQVSQSVVCLCPSFSQGQGAREHLVLGRSSDMDDRNWAIPPFAQHGMFLRPALLGCLMPAYRKKCVLLRSAREHLQISPHCSERARNYGKKWEFVCYVKLFDFRSVCQQRALLIMKWKKKGASCPL